MTRSEVQSKSITVETHSFHARLVDAILEGFVALPSSAYGTLESVFKVLTTAIETRSKTSDNIQQYIILQRYEYSPDTKAIRSCKLYCILGSLCWL
jgi:hypothetical protein